MKRLFIPFLPCSAYVALLVLCLTFNVEAAGPIAKPSKRDIPRSKSPARFASGSTEVLITLNGKAMSGRNNVSAAEYAAANGMPLLRPLRANKQMAVLKFNSIPEAQKAVALMRKDNKILSATYNRVLPHVPHAFVSDDPYFPQQWHLNDGLDATPGVSVAGPWANDFTGLGVTIGIIDEGVDKDHEDIAANFVDADSYDFAGNDADPSPEGSKEKESHGTSVAGVAAGVGGNGIGTTGAAPFAKIAGLKITFGGQSTVADFVDAVTFHSSGSNLAIQIKNHSYGFSFPYIDTPEEVAAFNVSTADGTIHTVSAGNDRFPYGNNNDGTGEGDVAEDSNKSALANNPNIIAVAALASSGIFADYSSLGSNVFVTASSSSFRDTELSILTTDRTDDVGYNYIADDSDDDSFADLNYTSTFGGTSSSAPLVAGVLALVKQANPALDVRVAKHLIARHSIQVDPTNPTWVTNAAGFNFSTDYGFGLIDANALVNAANSLAISPLQTRVSANFPVNKLVPDLGSVTQAISFGQTGKIEEIQVRLVVQTAYEGDLEATITSPQGTVSKFCHASTYDSESGTLDWWFTSNAFWGEQGVGNWTVKVSDTGVGDALTWKSVQLKVRSDTAVGVILPTNDDFVNATKLVGKQFSAKANIINATAEEGERQRNTIIPNHSIWYEWTAPVAGRLSINTLGSDTDTILSFYQGASLNDLTELVTNDNQGGVTKTSNIFTTVSKGSKYYIAIDAASGAARNVKLNGRLKGCGEK